MTHLFGKTWTNSYGLADRDGQWLATLKDLHPNQVAYGIEQVRRSGKDWPPSAPKFKELCIPTPEAMGLPALDLAWKEANDHAHQPDHYRWSHRAVFLAGRFTEWFRIRTATTPDEIRTVRERFKLEYLSLTEKLAQGKELEPVLMIESDFDPKAQADQRVKTVMEEQGINPQGGRAEYLKKMKGILG